MVDRVMVYTGALPQTYDILSTNKNMMFGIGYGMQMVLGTSTYVDGLGCLPTSPTADLNVHIQLGSIYSMTETDANAYSDLGTDTSSLVKQGLNLAIQTFNITPPSTSGYSQVFLIEAIYNDTDGGATVLSYYNAGNPSSPYSGPNNSGTSNYTVRQGKCVIAVKAGVAASTGTQVTPSPDSGYVGLYAITVTNGQTQITSTNIVQLTSAPIVSTKLPMVPAGVQSGQWLYAADTGTTNAMVAAVTPVPSSLTTGMEIHIKTANACTGAATLNLNGLGAIAIHRANGSALSSGDYSAGQVLALVYDGAYWQIANYFGFSSSTVNNNTTTVGVPYGADTSTTSNTVTVSPTPAITSLSAGQTLIVKLANPITGATTINVGSLAASTIVSQTGQTLTYGAAAAGEMMWLLYDGTHWQILNASLPLQNNLTIYVNSGIGSDSYDGSQPTVSGSKGPLQHIQTAVNKAFNYPPSIYTVTIQCANGTYAEAVTVGSTPGPSILVNGNNANIGSVIVTGAAYSHTFLVGGPNFLQVTNLSVTANQPAGNGVSPCCFLTNSSGSSLYVNNVAIGTSTNSGIAANFGSQASFQTVYVSGSYGGYILAASYNASLGFGLNAVFVFQGSVTASAFISCNFGASAEIPGGSYLATFQNAGNFTGAKFVVDACGTINTGGAGVNYFPGNSAGQITTNGVYV